MNNLTNNDRQVLYVYFFDLKIKRFKDISKLAV